MKVNIPDIENCYLLTTYALPTTQMGSFIIACKFKNIWWKNECKIINRIIKLINLKLYIIEKNGYKGILFLLEENKMWIRKEQRFG